MSRGRRRTIVTLVGWGLWSSFHRERVTLDPLLSDWQSHGGHGAAASQGRAGAERQVHLGVGLGPRSVVSRRRGGREGGADEQPARKGQADIIPWDNGLIQ